MFIDVEIQGKIFEFLVDTGATITLISRKVAQDHLLGEGSLEPLKSDILIADGTTLKIYGMQALKFSIHNRQFQHKMVVADLTVDGILGLDFLKSNDCTLNIANCSLILTKPESHIPCHYKGTLGCNRITLSENLTLPPLSEMLTFCN